MTRGDRTANGSNNTTTRTPKNASVRIDENELNDLTHRLERVRPTLINALETLLAPDEHHPAEPLADVLLKAACGPTTRNEAAHATPVNVSHRTLEKALATVNLNDVEDRINNDLWTQAQPLLPTRVHLAVDFKHIEYGGNADTHEHDELTRSRPKNGTKHVHRYVTVYRCRGNKRYTLAVHVVPGNEPANQALETVLAYLQPGA
jgi:hypothetical protein